MTNYQVADTANFHSLIANLNQVLSAIALRLAKLDGTSGAPIVPATNINLNGNYIYGSKANVNDPSALVAHSDLTTALNQVVQNLPALISSDETLLTRLRAVLKTT